ncbi:acetyl-CoA carboxylase biotin carboxylase subunit, partial [Campylobacter coli]
SHIYKDYTVPPYYDSMLAKLIIKATSYDLAVNKLERALKEFTIDIRTTIPFLIAITKTREFRRGYFDTSFIETHMQELLENTEDRHQDNKEEVIAAIAATLKKIRESRE